MKILKNIYGIMTVMVLLIASTALQSCKSDEDDLLDRFLNFPDKMTVKYGETVDLFGSMDGDVLVVPAALADLDFTVDDKKIVNPVDLQAVGLGSTVIRVYNNGECVSTIQVEVEPTARVTMVSGETKDISDLLPETPFIISLETSSRSIVKVDSSNRYTIGALKAGVAYVYSSSLGLPAMIEVTVTEGNLKELFPELIWLKPTVTQQTVEKEMAEYTKTSEGETTYGGREYYAIEYKPFDKAASVTFYMTKGYMALGTVHRELSFMIIETGKESSDVYPWLLNNFEPFYSSFMPTVFYLHDNWRMFPQDDSWNTILVRKN